jgi:DNA-binding MarR family transcriptional regulator
MSRTAFGSVAVELGDAVARINAHIRRDVVEAGVSLARARTLATLHRDGPRRLTDLALLEQVAQPTMSALINRLEVDGLISRGGDARDGRTVVVSITDAGRECLGRLIERRSRSLERSLDQLPDEDRNAIAAALPALRGLLEKMEDPKTVARPT